MKVKFDDYFIKLINFDALILALRDLVELVELEWLDAEAVVRVCSLFHIMLN